MFFLVLESSKKMSLKIVPAKVLDYLNKMVDPFRVRQLHSSSIARSMCHLAAKIDGHNLQPHCHCFSCRICRILFTTLLSRNHKKLWQIVKKQLFVHNRWFYPVKYLDSKKMDFQYYKTLVAFPLKIRRCILFSNLSKKFMICQIVRRAMIRAYEFLWAARVFCLIQITVTMNKKHFLFLIA